MSKIPSNYTEQQVVDIIDDITNKLCNKFKFGYHELEDIKQEAFILGWEALDRYDDKRPLPNFLYIHIKNRLINFKRNTYERLEKPCSKCPLKAYIKCEDKCTAYEKMEFCDLYDGWLKRNKAKKTLMHGENVEKDNTPSHRQIGEGDLDLNGREIEAYINTNLPVEYRLEYIKLKTGQRLQPQRKEFIENLILEILTEGGYV